MTNKAEEKNHGATIMELISVGRVHAGGKDSEHNNKHICCFVEDFKVESADTSKFIQLSKEIVELEESGDPPVFFPCGLLCAGTRLDGIDFLYLTSQNTFGVLL